jgi:hypothetical protein
MTRKCPMNTRQLVDEYFIENRHRLLDIAAFLDRLDRSSDGQDPGQDFRMRAFHDSLRELLSAEPGRTERVHMIMSDPTTEPRQHLDRKGAYGAYNPGQEVR